MTGGLDDSPRPDRPAGLFCGLLTLDILHRVERFPASDEKVTALDQTIAAGGPATNAAVTFAALGGRATLLTSVGSHPLAIAAAAEVIAHGVQVVDVTTARRSAPAVSTIRVGPDGTRNVSSPNAGGVDTSTWGGDVDRFDVVMGDGHLPELAREVVTAADAAAVPVVLDCGSRKDVFADLLPRADFVVASADYGRDALDEFADAGVAVSAQTRGRRPVRWASADGEGEIDVPPVDAVDTLGAGDAFHGAVAFAVAAAGGPTGMAVWRRVLEFAVAVAGVRVGHAGPRAWLTDPRLPGLARPWLDLHA